MTPSFWESSEQVERFAARDPDRRLVALLERYDHPSSVRVLDLGCAGGRNAEAAARAGFDVYAVDASQPMVERTRSRLRPIIGRSAADERVRVARMDDLDCFEDGFFDLVVALGIHHNAASESEWQATVAETARVLAGGGRVLVASFTPASLPGGRALERVAGEPHVFAGFESGPMFLLDADALDREMARHGLRAEVATETVRVETNPGRRVTANALYRKVTE